MAYVKLFGSILDSTVWDTAPATRLVWITLLAMADRDGVVEASVPGLAKRANVDRSDCERALALFLAPDPDSRTKDNEGRRIEEVDGGWRLINYEKYRDKATVSEKAAKNAERQRRYRQREAEKAKAEKRNADVTPVTPVTESDAGNTLRSISAAEAKAEREQSPPALKLKPEPQIEPGDVCREWHAAADRAGVSVMHAHSAWREEFGTIAAAINSHDRIDACDRARVLRKLCLWWWCDPEGPYGARRVPKLDPRKALKHISTDVERACASQWIAGQIGPASVAS